VIGCDSNEEGCGCRTSTGEVLPALLDGVGEWWLAAGAGTRTAPGAETAAVVARRVETSRSDSPLGPQLPLLPFCRILEPPHELVVHVGREFLKLLPRQAGQEGALNSGSTRTNAREKLTRLTRQQFQELSTDVYDSSSDNGGGLCPWGCPGAGPCDAPGG
jgi:hypothetical protein